MIHNHEVASSILAPATSNRGAYFSRRLFFLLDLAKLASVKPLHIRYGHPHRPSRKNSVNGLPRWRSAHLLKKYHAQLPRQFPNQTFGSDTFTIPSSFSPAYLSPPRLFCRKGDANQLPTASYNNYLSRPNVELSYYCLKK